MVAFAAMSLDTDRLGERIAKAMAKDRIPSLSLAVVHDGHLVHAQGFGQTSVEDGALPVTPSTLFRIASTSKPIAATAVLQLVGEGRIDLDAPVKSYLPWFTLSDAAASGTVTVRQLMSNQSGLPADNYPARGCGPEALERFVRHEAPRYQLVAEPGRVFVYSNPGINVAGYVAEAVSGVRFPEFVRQRIFEPLEMERSTFDPLVAMTYPLAQAHDVDEEGEQRVRHAFTDTAASHPAEGMFSTALDMAKYAQMLLNAGRFNGGRLLGERELAEMTRPHNRTFWPVFSPTASYGLMLFIDDYKGQPRWSHPGGAGGFLHTFELLPQTRSAVIIQANGGAGSSTGRALAQSIFDELLGLAPAVEPPVLEPDRSGWSAYVGTFANCTSVYEGAEPIGEVTVTIDGDDLVADHNGHSRVLTPIGPDFYQSIMPGSDSASNAEAEFMIGFYPGINGVVEWASVNGQPARRV